MWHFSVWKQSIDVCVCVHGLCVCVCVCMCVYICMYVLAVAAAPRSLGGQSTQSDALPDCRQLRGAHLCRPHHWAPFHGPQRWCCCVRCLCCVALSLFFVCVCLLSEGALHLITSRSEMLASHLEASNKKGLINWGQCSCLWNRGCVPVCLWNRGCVPVAENGDWNDLLQEQVPEFFSASFVLCAFLTPVSFSLSASPVCLSFSFSRCILQWCSPSQPLCGGDVCLTVSLSVMRNKLCGVGRHSGVWPKTVLWMAFQSSSFYVFWHVTSLWKGESFY